MPKEPKKWIAPVIMIIAAVVTAVNGILPLTVLLLLLPPVSAALAYASGPVPTAAACISAAAGCVYAIPGPFGIAGAGWCGLTCAIALTPFRRRAVRPILWAVLPVLMWVSLLAVLNAVYDGAIIPGLAQTAQDLVEASPDCVEILLRAYSSGLARLAGTEALVPAYSVMGRIVMTDRVKMQLLYSLRVSLEKMLPGMMCTVIIWHAAINTLLCVWLPDLLRRRNGEKGILPSPEGWYIPGSAGAAAVSLCAGWLLTFLAEEGPVYYLGLLCSNVFQVIFLIQGICLMLWLEKRMGMRVLGRTLWVLIMTLLAPVIPIVMGLIDQRRDIRNLRKMDIEEDTK
ncbi:MAG: YybS family protein [Clostridia bacterium]|nr:YybS family protein [Clostridia bacterium]